MPKPGTRITVGALRARATVAVAVVCVLSTFSVGCDGPAPRKATSTPKQVSAESAEKADREAAQLMDSVRGILSSTPDSQVFPTVLKQLRQYLERRADEVEPLDEAARAQILQYFGPGGLAEVERKEFTTSDLEYVRGCLFLGGVARYVRQSAKGDLEYARALFDWVVRYVQLEPNESRTGGTPLEICMRGTGSANERSWVFLELLRQAGLRGCVVGIPAREDAQRIAPWLCGLFVDDQVHLFDPTIGLPAPSGDGDIATLAELAANPALLAEAFSFGKGFEYPTTVAEAKRFSILLIVEPVMLAPRMRFLQDRLTGAGRAELFVDFDALQRQAFAALEPVTDNGGVHVWQFPKQQRDHYRQDHGTVWGTMNIAWLLMPDSPRLLQLQGDHDEAVRGFAIQNMDNGTPALVNSVLASKRMPPRIRAMTVTRCRQDIPYFLGVSKLDQRRPDAVVASNWIRRYLARYDAPPLRSGDVLDWLLFAKRLGAEEPDPPNPALRRFRSLLSDVTKAQVGKLAQRQKEALQAKRDAEAAGKASANPFVEVGRGSESEKSIIAALNELLERRDLFRAEDAPVGAQDAELRLLLEEDPQVLNERQVRRRNRLLLEAAFPQSIVHDDSVWIPGAIRHLALALREQGKTDEALRVIEKGHPDLEPIHQIGLRALARSWRDERDRGK